MLTAETCRFEFGDLAGVDGHAPFVAGVGGEADADDDA